MGRVSSSGTTWCTGRPSGRPPTRGSPSRPWPSPPSGWQLGPMVTPLARRRPWIVARQAVAPRSPLRTAGSCSASASGSTPAAASCRASARRPTTAGGRRCSTKASTCSPGLLAGDGGVAPRRALHRRRLTFLPTPGPTRRHPDLAGGPLAQPSSGRAGAPPRRRLPRSTPTIPADLAGIVERASALGRPFDVVVEGWPQAPVDGWEAAGATWWLAEFDPFTVTAAEVDAVVAAGPP